MQARLTGGEQGQELEELEHWKRRHFRQLRSSECRPHPGQRSDPLSWPRGPPRSAGRLGAKPTPGSRNFARSDLHRVGSARGCAPACACDRASHDLHLGHRGEGMEASVTSIAGPLCVTQGSVASPQASTKRVSTQQQKSRDRCQGRPLQWRTRGTPEHQQQGSRSGQQPAAAAAAAAAAQAVPAAAPERQRPPVAQPEGHRSKPTLRSSRGPPRGTPGRPGEGSKDPPLPFTGGWGLPCFLGGASTWWVSAKVTCRGGGGGEGGIWVCVAWCTGGAAPGPREEREEGRKRGRGGLGGAVGWLPGALEGDGGTVGTAMGVHGNLTEKLLSLILRRRRGGRRGEEREREERRGFRLRR